MDILGAALKAARGAVHPIHHRSLEAHCCLTSALRVAARRQGPRPTPGPSHHEAALPIPGPVSDAGPLSDVPSPGAQASSTSGQALSESARLSTGQLQSEAPGPSSGQPPAVSATGGACPGPGASGGQDAGGYQMVMGDKPSDGVGVAGTSAGLQAAAAAHALALAAALQQLLDAGAHSPSQAFICRCIHCPLISLLHLRCSGLARTLARTASHEL